MADEAPPSGPAADSAAPTTSGDALPTSSAPPTEHADTSPDRRKTGWRRWLPLAGVIGFIAACAIAMLLILGFQNGIPGLIIGLVAAILPVPVLVGCFLWLDRYEPEPNRYLVFCFAWGACVATLVAIGVNTGGAYVFEQLGLPDALVAVLIAPFIEESMKALGPILLLWRRRREWSGITDGIVYCGLSAIGFAMVENVLYLGGHGYAQGADDYGPATGIQNVFLIFIVRILFTGFAHPLFTSMTGVGLGLASRAGDRRVKWLAPIAGLLMAMILHGMFNGLPTLSVATGESLIMLYGYLGFMVPFFFATVGFAIALRGWEGRLSERVLPFYVRAGWFAPPEVASLSTLGRRHSARRWAKRVAGDAGMKAMRSFQFASTRLAIVRDGMQRGLNKKPADAARAADEEQRLLAEIVGYRAVFTGRDPQMPHAFWNGNDYQIAFPDGVTRTVNQPIEPVVPLPVRMAPQPAMAAAGWGAPPFGGYGSAPQGYGPPRYATPPPGYGQAWGGAYGQPAPAPAPTGGYGYGYGGPASGPYGAAPGGYGYGVPASGPAYGAGPGSSAAGPGYTTPGYTTPGYTTPGYTTPGYTTPGYGTDSVTGHAAPAPAAPGYGAPGHAAPGYPAPGQSPGSPTPAAPGYGASQYGQQPNAVPQAQAGPDATPSSGWPATGTPNTPYGPPPTGGNPAYPPAQPQQQAPSYPQASGYPHASGGYLQASGDSQNPSYSQPPATVQPGYSQPPVAPQPGYPQASGYSQPGYPQASGHPQASPYQQAYQQSTAYPEQPTYPPPPGTPPPPPYASSPDATAATLSSGYAESAAAIQSSGHAESAAATPSSRHAKPSSAVPSSSSEPSSASEPSSYSEPSSAVPLSGHAETSAVTSPAATSPAGYPQTPSYPPAGYPQTPSYPPAGFPQPTFQQPPSAHPQPPATSQDAAYGDPSNFGTPPESSASETPRPSSAGGQQTPQGESAWSTTGSPWGEAPETRPFATPQKATPKDSTAPTAQASHSSPEPTRMPTTPNHPTNSEPETRPIPSAPSDFSPGWAAPQEPPTQNQPASSTPDNATEPDPPTDVPPAR